MTTSDIMTPREMSKILDRIFIGTYHSAQMLDYGNRESITHVLNCTKDPHQGLKHLHVRQVNIDDGFEIPAELVFFAIQSIGEAVHGGGKILVHCHAGISRSPSLVTAYLMDCGYSWDDAIELIRQQRPYIQPHPRVALSVKKALGQYISPATTLLGGE